MNRSELEEERSFLVDSLEDLEREREAGDLDQADYERLRSLYEQRAALVEEELGRSLGPGGDDGRSAVGSGGASAAVSGRAGRRGGRPSKVATRLSTRRARLVTGWTAVGCFAAAAVLLAMSLADVGPFATTPQLSVDARVQIMLAEASVLGSKGEVTEALATYDRVLALRPTQPVALADGGWLARLSGLSQHDPSLLRNGDAEIEAAVKADPSYAVARAYDGVLLYEDRGQATAAATQFRAMLKDGPSATLLWTVRSDALSAFHAAHQPVPSEIQAATKPPAQSAA